MARYEIELKSILAKKTSDMGSSKDELWFVMQADAGAPMRYPMGNNYKSLAPGKRWSLGGLDGGPLRVSFDWDFSLTLFDVTSLDITFDIGFGDSEFIGCAGIVGGSSDASPLHMTNGDNSSYELEWRWTRNDHQGVGGEA